MPDRRELELRLADALALLRAVPGYATDELIDAGAVHAIEAAIVGEAGCNDVEDLNAERARRLDELREDLGLEVPLADGATEGRNLGPSLGVEGLRPGGITRFSPDYRTVLLDSIGAVALKLSPTGELGVYLELGGRVNKRQERDEGAYLMPPAMAAELVAELIVAGHAAGGDLAEELLAHIDRKRDERGLGSPRA